MSSLNPNTAVPPPSQNNLDRGYGASTPSKSHMPPTSAATDFGSTPGPPVDTSLLSQSVAQQNSGRFNEEWDASQRGSSIIDGPLQRSNSVTSGGEALIPSRGGTLKKKASMRRTGSFKRSSSRRSSRAGSVRSLALVPSGDVDDMHSAFFSPVPTSGNPTEILANRFQAWRKLLKDIITYFREIQASYDHRAKNLLKISNVINNTTAPSVYLTSGGIDDACQVLRAYHKSSIAEANKSKDIENDVILALVGLRSDLQQKIKEIKSLSGDFKNSVDKEMDNTRKAVNELQDGLGQSDIDPAQMVGKKDPYLLKLAADRQVERQIDEENYLHQAYLNLEASGRELEAIVVGEIQKSYNAYAGILKREADAAYATIDDLRTGPIAMPKDHEWNAFIENDEHFVDPRIPVRESQNIHYPGRDNELAQEVRAGLLERKSKYLKSYTAGWYVLSPTHLHEFKSADKTQAPIMSLYLPEQKLGSHSTEGSSSNKFMLKGRQTGSMHRGHSWVFRCESHETMLSWYEALKHLTEKSPQERNAFVRQHARSISGTSARSVSSDGMVDDEDEEPFSATNSAIVAPGPREDVSPRRPQPGGRFPSDLNVETLSQRGLLNAPLSPSSGSSGFGDVQDRDVKATAALPGSGIGRYYGEDEAQHGQPSNREISTGTAGATGLGGAAAGFAAAQVYRNYEEERKARMDQYRQQQEALAAREASVIAAPDFTNDGREAQATHEATLMAAPDTRESHAAVEAAIISAPDAPKLPLHPSYMSGARSQGDLQTAAAPNIMSDAYPVQAVNGDLQTQDVPNPLDTVLRPLTQEPSRPNLPTGALNASTNSISNLHIPGEYPRGRQP